MVALKQKYIFKDLVNSVAKFQDIQQSSQDDVFTFGDGKKVFYEVDAKAGKLKIYNKSEFLENLNKLVSSKNSPKGLKDFYQKISDYAEENQGDDIVLSVNEIKMDLKLGLTLQMTDSCGVARKFKLNAMGLQVIPQSEKEYIAIDINSRKNFFLENATLPKNFVEILDNELVTFGRSIGIELFNEFLKLDDFEKYIVKFKSYGKDNSKINEDNRELFATRRKIQLLRFGDNIYIPSGSSAVAIPISARNIRLVYVDDEFMLRFIPNTKTTAHSTICLAGLSQRDVEQTLAFIFDKHRDKVQSVLRNYELCDENEDYLEPNRKSQNNTIVKVENVNSLFDSNENKIMEVQNLEDVVEENEVNNQNNTEKELENIVKTENVNAKEDGKQLGIISDNKNKQTRKDPNFILINPDQNNTNNVVVSTENEKTQSDSVSENQEIEQTTIYEVEEVSNNSVDKIKKSSKSSDDKNSADTQAEAIEVVEETNKNEEKKSEEKTDDKSISESSEKVETKQNDKNFEVSAQKEEIEKLTKERDEANKKIGELEKEINKIKTDKKYFYFSKSFNFLIGVAFFGLALLTGNPYLLIGAYMISTIDDAVSMAFYEGAVKNVANVVKGIVSTPSKVREFFRNLIDERELKRTAKLEKKQQKANKKAEKKAEKQNKKDKKKDKKVEKQEKKQNKKAKKQQEENFDDFFTDEEIDEFQNSLKNKKQNKQDKQEEQQNIKEESEVIKDYNSYMEKSSQKKEDEAEIVVDGVVVERQQLTGTPSLNTTEFIDAEIIEVKEEITPIK